MIEESAFSQLEQRYLAERRQYLPWTKAPANVAEEQEMIRELLKKHAGAEISPSAYISPEAKIFTSKLRIDARTWVASNCIVRGTVALGEDCSVNPFAVIAGRVSIGSGVRIASLSSIYGFNHGYKRTSVPIFRQKSTSIGVTIGDGVWIGANAVILDGSVVSDHAIVAAGAVVKGRVEEYAIVGGNPARVLKFRRQPTAADNPKNPSSPASPN